MIYLFDADTLIRADKFYYPLKRFPVFWDWLEYMGNNGHIKVPLEQYEEITVGKGELVDWLKDQNIREALQFAEEAKPELVSQVTINGYGPLDEHGVEGVGRDPFLISYAFASDHNRCVVTFEVSKPSKKGKNRKIPDVCHDLGVGCVSLFDVIDALDFTTDWKP